MGYNPNSDQNKVAAQRAGAPQFDASTKKHIR